MTIIDVRGKNFDVDCVVLDKDGTLIDLNTIWGPRTKRWGKFLADAFPEQRGIDRAIFENVGYLPELSSIRSESPMAVASLESIITLAAGVLCQVGVPWHEAITISEKGARVTLMAPLDSEEINPIGDVSGTLNRFVGAQIKVVMVTSDDRSITCATLKHLGIDDLIHALVCGDDGMPNKPAPDAIEYISGQLGIPANRMVMVGDSLSDMKFGRNARVAGCVGVQNGGVVDVSLAAIADVVIESIEEISIDCIV